MRPQRRRRKTKGSGHSLLHGRAAGQRHSAQPALSSTGNCTRESLSLWRGPPSTRGLSVGRRARRTRAETRAWAGAAAKGASTLNRKRRPEGGRNGKGRDQHSNEEKRSGQEACPAARGPRGRWPGIRLSVKTVSAQKARRRPGTRSVSGGRPWCCLPGPAVAPPPRAPPAGPCPRSRPGGRSAEATGRRGRDETEEGATGAEVTTRRGQRHLRTAWSSRAPPRGQQTRRAKPLGSRTPGGRGAPTSQ